MKLFIADFRWAGAVIVVAENLEEAKAKAKELGEDGLHGDDTFEEVDITKAHRVFGDE
jgi:hypothetical protein